MTDQLNVSQRAREAAADVAEWHSAAKQWESVNGGTMQWFADTFPARVRDGSWDNHDLVQAFARFERELSTNKDETIAKLRCAVEAALDWIWQDDFSQMGPAEDAAHTRLTRKLKAALTSTEKEG